jgi:transcription initiation factor TFIIIB Brf1 subunit/transcription initiation factor TFIIB
MNCPNCGSDDVEKNDLTEKGKYYCDCCGHIF